jgi:GTPase SAR1 family protein
MSSDPHLGFKVVLMGNEGVGKTSLVNRHGFHEFSTNLPSTVGFANIATTIQLGTREIPILI